MRITVHCSAIVRGPELFTKISTKSFGINVFEALKRYAANENPALLDISSQKSMSFKDLLYKSTKLGNYLRNNSINRNHVVSLCSENNVDFFAPAIASFYEGAPIATINHSYSEGELLHVMKIVKPTVAFCSGNDGIHDKFYNLQKKGDIPFVKDLILMEELEDRLENEATSDYLPKETDNTEKHTAIILFSSGTTGLPKGVMLSHNNLNARFNQASDPRQSLSYLDDGLLVVPFYHALGFMMGMGLIQKGKTLRFLPKFNERHFLQGIQDYKVKYLQTVPPLMCMLAKSPLVEDYNLSSIEEIICGAAPLSSQTEQAVLKRLPNVKKITQAYGQTEMTLSILCYGTEDKAMPGSSGKVIAGHEVIVRDPATGSIMGQNQVGEICGKGPVVMQGYFDNDAATKETFTEDGWLRSGDLGYYDGNGYFYIVDRLKELIKYKGFQVAPAELEALLLEHNEISDAAVTGMPDERCGEKPIAFVIKKPRSKVTEDEIMQFIEKRVSSAKRLHFVYFVDTIPKTASGKLLRKDLKNLLKNLTAVE